MASKFDSVVLKAMEDAQPLNQEKCIEIGEKFGFSWRSIVAGAKKAGFAYTRKVRTNKQGEKPVRKAEYVQMISEGFGLELSELDGLDKATVTALKSLVSVIPESEPEASES